MKYFLAGLKFVKFGALCKIWASALVSRSLKCFRSAPRISKDQHQLETLLIKVDGNIEISQKILQILKYYTQLKSLSSYFKQLKFQWEYVLTFIRHISRNMLPNIIRPWLSKWPNNDRLQRPHFEYLDVWLAISHHVYEVIDHVLLLTSINLNNMPEAISKSQQPLSQNFKTNFTQQPCSNKLCKKKLIILYLELLEAFCLFWW